MNIDLILSLATVIAGTLTISSFIASIEKVLRKRKIEKIKLEQKKINEEIVKNEEKLESLYNELRKLKYEIDKLPEEEIPEDDRKKLVNLIDKIIEKRNSLDQRYQPSLDGWYFYTQKAGDNMACKGKGGKKGKSK